MRTAVKSGSSLDELLQAELIKEEWAKIWGEEDNDEQAANAAGGTTGSTPVQLVTGEAEHPLADKIAKVAVALTPDQETLVTQAETSVTSAVDSLISTVPVAEHGDLKSVKNLAEALRSLPVFRINATDSSSVLLLYEVDGAGEHETCPRRSGTPIRKGHLDLVVQSAMLARADAVIHEMVELDDWNITPSGNDVLLVS